MPVAMRAAPALVLTPGSLRAERCRESLDTARMSAYATYFMTSNLINAARERNNGLTCIG